MDENNELMAPEYHIDYTDSQVTVSENWLYVDPQSRDLHGLIFEERVGYLNHSFVESPDMMNMYNGNVVLNHKGKAWVELPEWFETLNRDFRYQLTPIGVPGPNLYIAEEISETRFRIAGGTTEMKVSWQVTGIRQNPWANANRLPVEEDKTDRELGYYLHPELYGQPDEKGIGWARNPEMMEGGTGKATSVNQLSKRRLP